MAALEEAFLKSFNRPGATALPMKLKSQSGILKGCSVLAVVINGWEPQITDGRIHNLPLNFVTRGESRRVETVR